MLLGLTNHFRHEFNELVNALQEFGITTLEQAEQSGLLSEKELRRLKIGVHHQQHPEHDLFNREARILEGLSF